MNRRRFLATAVACAIAPRVPAAEPASMWPDLTRYVEAEMLSARSWASFVTMIAAEPMVAGDLVTFDDGRAYRVLRGVSPVAFTYDFEAIPQ